MKYLKLFESFSSSVREIDWDTWWYYVNKTERDEFTQSEVNQINDFIRRYENNLEYDRFLEFNNDKTYYIVHEFQKVEKSPDRPRGKDVKKSISFLKRLRGDDPDWFYIGYSEYTNGEEELRNFECSTFEDLIEKLEELVGL